MRPVSRSFGLVMAFGLLFLLGVTLWVGLRVGAATLWEQSVAAEAPPGLLGEGRLSHPPRDGHGAVGQVTRLEAERLTLVNRDGEERVVLFSADTLLVKGNPRTVTPTRVGDLGPSELNDLQPGARIVVIGKPNADGQLEARIIRINVNDPNSDRSRSPSERKGRPTP